MLQWPEQIRIIRKSSMNWEKSNTVPVKSVPLRNVKTEIIGWINVWRKTMTNVHVQQKAGIILIYLNQNFSFSVLFP
jgi:hypothetical protein